MFGANTGRSAMQASDKKCKWILFSTLATNKGVSSKTTNLMKTKMDCPYCDGSAILKDEIREIKYKESALSVKAYFYRCESCQEEFTTTETDTHTMKHVLNV